MKTGTLGRGLASAFSLVGIIMRAIAEISAILIFGIHDEHDKPAPDFKYHKKLREESL